LHDMVVGLIHWSQFEIPDISISDITIPTRTFPLGILPTASDLKSMASELISNLQKLGNRIPKEYFELISKDSELLSFSPEMLFKNLQVQTESNWQKSCCESEGFSSQHDESPVLDGFGK
ncbi:hypothetical protein EAY21_24435, partial [Vibrio anguillarum]|nr:hypothetical protein [Vibrio anguillarum]